MPQRFVGFIGPSYTLSSVNVDCQRSINLYPEVNELGTGNEREIASLKGTPGLSLLVNLDGGPVRGVYTASNGTLFVVSRTTLYSISTSWVATSLGTVSTNSGPVSMSDNGISLILVDGTFGYTLNLSTLAFAQIVDANFPGADQVAFIDGYFIFNKPASGQFYISGLNATTFSGLDVALSEGSPDNIVGLLAAQRYLWVFNSQTTEIFYDSGNTFPFDRVQGAFIERGCAAAFSIAKFADSVFWLGADDKGRGEVYMAKGFQPQKISTQAVDIAIQSYSNISNATAYTYQDGGHQFYVLNFPSAGTTWVYDVVTSLWHERVYTNNGKFERHRADNHAYFNGTHVVGDYVSGNLYALSSSVYTDNGNPITRQRVSPHISQDMVRLFYSSFQLDLEVGVGLDGTGQGTDPQIALQWSDDAGHTWSNEYWVSMGVIGATKARAIWRRLGRARDRVFKVTTTEPVKTVFIGAELDYQAGVS